MVVGHYLSRDLSHKGAVRALKSALKHLPDIKGVIHHSDRGVQYCCHNFLDEIQKWKLQSSMTDGDHCAQNALAECMNGILKREFLLGCEHPSFSAADRAVDEAVLNYNHLRVHGSLKGKTPAEIHHGFSSLFELWARELFSFQAPIPKLARKCVNSI
jgi:putative transposase